MRWHLGQRGGMRRRAAGRAAADGRPQRSEAVRAPPPKVTEPWWCPLKAESPRLGEAAASALVSPQRLPGPLRAPPRTAAPKRCGLSQRRSNAVKSAVPLGGSPMATCCQTSAAPKRCGPSQQLRCGSSRWLSQGKPAVSLADFLPGPWSNLVGCSLERPAVSNRPIDGIQGSSRPRSDQS